MPKRAITGFGVTLILILLIALFFYFNFTTVVVSGTSMLPTFQDHQRLLASKAYWLVGAVQDNDVVVIKMDGSKDYIIKRVYKMAGETVDWKNVPEDYPLTRGEYKVPDDSIFVLGDNRPVSEDSRKFGPIKVEQILGKIVRR